MAETELKPKAKEEVPAQAERVRPGRVFLPGVDIFETPEALTLVVDMPGVPGDKVTLDIKDNHLTISGEITPPQAPGEKLLLQEYYTGDFHREFHLGAIIDQAKIEASMKDGVLRLLLPKAEKAKPRKIEVKVG
jgi:HSP20 family protein